MAQAGLELGMELMTTPDPLVSTSGVLRLHLCPSPPCFYSSIVFIVGEENKCPPLPHKTVSCLPSHVEFVSFLP